MKQSGLMTLHFLFVDGARAELGGDHIVLHEQNKAPVRMLIDELPQARINELLSFGVIKLMANPMEVTWPTPATPA